MNFLLFLCGVFVLVDGLANVLYCLLKRVHYPLGKLFQVGRIVRTVAGILILLVACGTSAQAQNTITVFQDEQFEAFSGSELVTFQSEFNLTLPKGNCTLNLNYENTLEGIKYTDSFLKSVTVLLNNKPCFTKTFTEDTVQGFTFNEQISVTTSGNQTGLLVLAGVGEQKFYGTFSMSFEVPGSGSEDFKPLGLEGWAWILIFSCAGVIAIVMVAKRRHSN